MAKKFLDYQIDGKPVPGVTTFLGAAIAKPQLMYWYGKHGTTECQRILKESSEYGDYWHKIIDSVLQGQVPSLSGKDKSIVDNFINVTKDWKYVGGEFKVLNKELMYGGTIDNLFIVNGEPVLCDVKTGSSVYPEHTLQIAAYMMASPLENPEYKETWSKIKKAFILHLDKATGTWEKLDRTPTEFDREAVKNARKIYDWVVRSRG